MRKKEQGENKASPMFDLETSSRMAKVVKRKASFCWRNAINSLPYLSYEAHYVEGWLIIGSLDIFNSPTLVEHGWCELGDRIIDPTLFDYPRQPGQYFAGIRYTHAEAAKAMRKTGNQLPFAWQLYGWEGLEHPGYLSAWQKAISTLPRPRNGRILNFTERDARSYTRWVPR